MVTDIQVRRLRKLIHTEPTLSRAATKAGMSEPTARKYLRSGALPSASAPERSWRTRPDPFTEVWPELAALLRTNPGLQAKTLFDYVRRLHPGHFPDGQLRTLQRRVKVWRALEGPPREVYFEQVHEPGKLCQSDFTNGSTLGVTIAGQGFEHLIYHFVLTYSNWETGTICFSESFESLSEGLQNALWELGGVPAEHQTDRMSAAVHRMDHPEAFTQRYEALLAHYGMRGRRIQAGCANENGDIEQRHYRFKDAVDQALMLRGERDFVDRAAYVRFLREISAQLNAGRQERLREELAVLRALPAMRLPTIRRVRARVRHSSTISVLGNVYSVSSRLIGEELVVRVGAEHLELWYGQRRVEELPRLRGRGRHRIDYRHIIDWLVRKPGAFENYRYREELFPTTRFRVAYDELRASRPGTAVRQYLGILKLAAEEGERKVEEALGVLLARERAISVESVEALLGTIAPGARVPEVAIEAVDLGIYDELLVGGEEATCPLES
jgi:hypothetical protein